MLFVAIIPSFVWVALLLVGWTALAYRGLISCRVRNKAMTGLVALTALQLVAGACAAIATSVYAIGPMACSLGVYGVLLSPVLFAVEAVFVMFLASAWSRRGDGTREGFAGWVSLWVVFCLIAFLTHARSAALCTV